MQITHCKLEKKAQRKLVEYFVLEVSARSAADLLDINPNSAALFYRKIRQVISHYLSMEANEVFAGQVVEALLARSRFLAYLSEAGKSSLSWLMTQDQIR